MNGKQLKLTTFFKEKEGKLSSDKTNNQITEFGSSSLQPDGPTPAANQLQASKRLCVRVELERESDCESVKGDCDLHSVSKSDEGSSDEETGHPRKEKDSRQYTKSWEKVYPWLYLDKSRNGAFCKLCERHASGDIATKQRTGGVFISIPFTNYRKATGKTGKLTKHASSQTHQRSVELENCRLQAAGNPIYNQILNQNIEETKSNRQSFIVLLTGLYYLCKEEIAHTTKYESLVNRVLRKCNDSLDSWIKSRSERATYISRATACELLECIGECLDKTVTDSVENCKYALMADESTNVSNQSELSICIRCVRNSKPVEIFLTIVTLADTKAETVTDAICHELSKRNFCLDNLVAFGFDGAANFSGNISGVRRRISDKAQREIPYVHCRAHVLSLAITSTRNKFPKIKRIFFVLKDIYKLFHKSPKREHILHSVQEVLNDPVLRIPEATDVRWLSHHKVVNAVVRSYLSIMVACEHIHTDGADLASLAGGILLDMQTTSFLTLVCGLNEVLGAVSNLSLMLQRSSMHASSLTSMVTATVCHLQEIHDKCDNDDFDVLKTVQEIKSNALQTLQSRRIVVDDNAAETMRCLKSFTQATIAEMNHRFDDKAMKLFNGCAIFDNTDAFLRANPSDIEYLCNCFGVDAAGCIADFKSFKHYLSVSASSVAGNTCKPYELILQVNIGYEQLRTLTEAMLCIPVSTASVERSFSTMNRIHTKLRNRMGEETIDHLMRISCEGPDDPPLSLLNAAVDLYARKKPRRIPLI